MFLLLDTARPADDRERAFLDRMQALATLGEPACRRDTWEPGHFTASALVLSPDGGSLALVFHPKLLRWLQPGGHLEPEDESALDAARREVAEEIGLTDLSLLGEGIFDIDIHDIPARRFEPAHQHFDLRFAFRSPTAELGGEHEARWVPLEAVNAVESDASVMRAVQKLLARR